MRDKRFQIFQPLPLPLPLQLPLQLPLSLPLPLPLPQFISKYRCNLQNLERLFSAEV